MAGAGFQGPAAGLAQMAHLGADEKLGGHFAISQKVTFVKVSLHKKAGFIRDGN